jgi:hypothetical protein
METQNTKYIANLAFSTAIIAKFDENIKGMKSADCISPLLLAEVRKIAVNVIAFEKRVTPLDQMESHELKTASSNLTKLRYKMNLLNESAVMEALQNKGIDLTQVARNRYGKVVAGMTFALTGQLPTKEQSGYIKQFMDRILGGDAITDTFTFTVGQLALNLGKLDDFGNVVPQKTSTQPNAVAYALCAIGAGVMVKGDGDWKTHSVALDPTSEFMTAYNASCEA